MLLVSASAFAQGFKIGYTQIDAIVFSMPEMVSVDADLKVYQAQLASLVNTKKVEFDNKMNEYQVIAQQPTTLPAVLQEKQVELQRLDADFNDWEQDAAEYFEYKAGQEYRLYDFYKPDQAGSGFRELNQFTWNAYKILRTDHFGPAS
jgi:outer membrane protein